MEASRWRRPNERLILEPHCENLGQSLLLGTAYSRQTVPEPESQRAAHFQDSRGSDAAASPGAVNGQRISAAAPPSRDLDLFPSFALTANPRRGAVACCAKRWRANTARWSERRAEVDSCASGGGLGGRRTARTRSLPCPSCVVRLRVRPGFQYRRKPPGGGSWRRRASQRRGAGACCWTTCGEPSAIPPGIERRQGSAPLDA